MGLLVQPQEIEVWYVLPAIRRELAKTLKEAGQSQKSIAQLLNVTEAAVSQYFNVKRAKEVKFNKEILTEVKKAAERIMKDSDAMIPETQRLLELAWEHNLVCELHKAHCSGLPKNCTWCVK